MVEENSLEDDRIREIVREQYGRVALERSESSSCCGPTVTTENSMLSSCSTNSCSPITIPGDKVEGFMEKYSAKLGYTEEDLKSIPDGANLGLGCGNPTALASIQEGETVLDLGAGGGLDCFIAANKVGKTGKVIGVDMTSQMIDRARANAKKRQL